MMRKFAVLLSLLWWMCGCGGRQEVQERTCLPEIFPDYCFVTIPVNIAPLNFRVTGADRVEVEFRKRGKLLLMCQGQEGIDIPLKKWHRMLQENQGDSLEVKVFARNNQKWAGYQPFQLYVTADSIDPYLAYRLIEPGYELGKRLSLRQRELSSFQEKAFVPAELIEGSCVNCHSFCNYSPDRFMFHVRWKNPGTIVAEPGKLRRINTKTENVISAGVYRMWHPSGNYIAFSNNETYQAFHAFHPKKIEVYDIRSDLMIYDVYHNKVLTDERFKTPELWETFPVWSPDGKYLYFCRAEAKNMPMEYKKLKYDLYRVGFDEQTGLLEDSIECVAIPQAEQKSISFPALSPDGRYVLYTVAANATFPIWHKDADLEMLDLQTGELVDMQQVNSDCADSYHAWSSSGRWIAFSSRRMDNLYTYTYFAYFDREGRMHKPFVLPQQDPGFYDFCLKSFNIPEFIKGPVTISPYWLEEVIQGEVQNAL